MSPKEEAERKAKLAAAEIQVILLKYDAEILGDRFGATVGVDGWWERV